MRDDLSFDLEERLGMDVGSINRELDKGLAGNTTPWEGADAFHARKLKEHRDVAGGGSQD